MMGQRANQKKKGRVWDERWKELHQVSTGGQGLVYAVEDLRDDGSSQFVLKAIKDARFPERIERFRVELRALEQLNHRGIPRLVGYGAMEDKNSIYLVLEKIEGQTLEDVVSDGPLPLETAVRLVSDLLGILSYCHDHDVLHRDIKPSNIVVDSSGRPTLIDFGLAYLAEGDDLTVTVTNQAIGNRFLALPEQQVGGAQKRDPRSDVTQCVGVLFYCLSGRHPGQLLNENGEKPHEAWSGYKDTLDMPTQEVLSSLFSKGFEQRLESRWQSSHELRAAVELLLSAGSPRVDLQVSTDQSLFSTWVQRAEDAERWRQAQAELPDVRQLYDEALRGSGPLRTEDGCVDAVAKGIEASRAVFVAGLAAVGSSVPDVRRSCPGLLHQLVNPSDWTRGGDTRDVEFPCAVGLAFQALVGARLMSIRQVGGAFRLANSRIRLGGSRAMKVIRSPRLISLCAPLTGLTEAWAFVDGLYRRFPWVADAFSGERDFRASLCCYYHVLNIFEFADIVGCGEGESLSMLASGQLDYPSVTLHFSRVEQSIMSDVLFYLDNEKEGILAQCRSLANQSDLSRFWPDWVKYCEVSLNRAWPFHELQLSHRDFLSEI